MALPGAEPLEIVAGPTVTLHPDGVEVRLDDGAVVVWLGDHFCEVALDREAIAAAVAAVRNEVAAARGYR